MGENKIHFFQRRHNRYDLDGGKHSGLFLYIFFIFRFHFLMAQLLSMGGIPYDKRMEAEGILFFAYIFCCFLFHWSVLAPDAS
ncbi:hypothetical protein QBC38DRAFT_22689 [Podospora fimiseda]|uniref:Uncharacterized protein n=1 Tax=Podospora fimiseda TaxID=252190 RepID=A0AAN7BW81_9PEZI|nr:hypothetical protein QBC38DRAFT_22689 [Podospora fimiseda]